MTPEQADARRRYELAVSSLADELKAARERGDDEEAIARRLVAERNAIKVAARAADDPAVVALMEARNLARYGHPVGPDADWFFTKYKSWAAVADAACRFADLSRGL